METMKRKIAIALFAYLSLSPAKGQVASGYEWRSLPFGGGGFVSALIDCPQEEGLFFARTDVGGAYRWNAEEQSWTPLLDFLPENQVSLMGVESLAVDPSSPNRVFLYCGTPYWNNGLFAILYSEDYGDNFKTVATVTSKFPANGNGGGRQSGEMLAVNPANGKFLLCGSRSNGLWKSTNSGSSWLRVAPSTFPNDVKISFVHFIDSAKVLVGIQRKGKENLYLSENAASTWKAVDGQRTDYMIQRCTMSPDSSCVYLTYSDESGPGTNGEGAIMKLSLTDGSWSDISPTHHAYGEVSVAKDHPQWLVTSTLGIWEGQHWTSSTTWGDQIYVSKNGGKSWTNLMASGKSIFSEREVAWMSQGKAQLHWCGSVKIDPFNSNHAFFTSGQGIFMTENLFASRPKFQMAVRGLEETVPTDIVSCEGIPLTVSMRDYDGCFYTSYETYPKPFSTKLSESTSAVAVGGTNHKVMLKAGNSVYYSSNGGTTWIKKNTPDGCVSFMHCAVSADGSILMLTPEGSQKPCFSLDKGSSWTELSGAVAGTYVYADPLNDNLFYGVRSNKLYRFFYEKESGKFSTKTTTLTSVVNEHRICVVPGRTGELWIARGSSGLYHVTGCDASIPQLKTISMSSATCVGVGKAKDSDSPLAIYIWGKKTSGQKIGIYRSDDDGKTWIRITDDHHQFGGPGNAQLLVGDMNEYGRVFMSTVGRGVVTGSLSESVADGIDSVMPDATSFPPSKGIYDLGGRKIEDNSLLKPGIYIINGKKIMIKSNQ